MQFVCRVGTPDGRVREEVVVASDEVALRTELGKLGLHLFEVRRKGLPKGLTGTGAGRRRRRIPTQEFLIFNQEMAALLKAGLPLLQALDLLLERMGNQRFKAVLGDIRDRVKSGADLSEAFAAHGELFPRLYPSTLKAGERSGELEAIVRRFIRYLRLLLDARRRVVSALVYPVVLVCVSIAMVTVMALYVVPKFMGIFQELGTELPLVTRLVLSGSSFVIDNWIALLIGLGVVLFVLLTWSRTERGVLAIDRAKVRLPLVGGIFHRFSLAELCRSLATLLSGGLPLVPALEIAVSAVGNSFIRSRLVPAIQQVREGKPFHVALEKSEIFTGMAIDMVKVGEATGSLDEMLTSVADFLDEQIETRMQRLLTLVEPLMLVFMGILIALLLIAIYLPLFTMLGQSQF